MSWYLNRKIRTKIIAAFVIVACLAAAIGTIGIINIKTVDDNDTILYEEMTVPISILAQFSEAFQRTRVDTREMLLFDSTARIQKEYDKIKEKRASNETLLNDYEARIANNEEMKMVFGEFKSLYSEYNKTLDQVANSIILGNVQQGWESINTGNLHNIEYQLIDLLDTLRSSSTLAGKEQARYNTEITNNAIFKMTMIIGVAFLMAILLGVFIASQICKPIKELVKASDLIAIGDTDVIIQEDRKDELGHLMASFKKMVDAIREQVAVSEEIAAGNFDVDIPIRSEKDVLNKSIQHMNRIINNTSKEIINVIHNVEAGKFIQDNDFEGLEGGWKEIAEGISRIVDSFVSYFDALPIVVMAIDKEYNINYLNKTGADMFGDKQEDACGKKCYDYWGTEDCGTATCVCDRTMKDKNVAVSDNIFNLKDKQMHIYCSAVPIIDGKGNVTGSLEVILDQTQIKQAQIVSDKQAKYQKIEVEKLVSNLEKFAQGKLDITTSVEPDDQDTQEIANNFRKINSSLEASTNQIRSYIDELSKILSDMAAKDFTVEIQREYLGDFVKIKESINFIIHQFNTILKEIDESAQQVGSGSKQVATSSQGLSQGASEQAGSIEEITASIMQIADQTRENADNANKANDLSIQIKSDAHTGNSQMDEMLKAMNDIKDSSNNISNIIKVIDEIAFQTNILALNAAVEAARAGEHGKGFAVVAEEVRNLAARSAKAAKETTDLIDNSINKVDNGYKIANETAVALGQIVTGVESAVEIMSMINNSSKEQSNALSEINHAIEEISQVTQNNTASAEESASASEQMADQAQLLKALIEEFNLRNENYRIQSNSYDGETLGQDNDKLLLENILEDNPS